MKEVSKGIEFTCNWLGSVWKICQNGLCSYFESRKRHSERVNQTRTSPERPLYSFFFFGSPVHSKLLSHCCPPHLSHFLFLSLPLPNTLHPLLRLERNWSTLNITVSGLLCIKEKTIGTTEVLVSPRGPRLFHLCSPYMHYFYTWDAKWGQITSWLDNTNRSPEHQDWRALVYLILFIFILLPPIIDC